MQQNVFDEKLYTSTEVAEILGVSLRSIYRYMEEGKLHADVKTATGRHRFTRKNINDFLHPGKQTSPQEEKSFQEEPESRFDTDLEEEVPFRKKMEDNVSDVSYKDEDLESRSSVGARPYSFEKSTSFDKGVKRETKVETSTQQEDEEPVDWLARFRQAAEKYRSQTASNLSAKEQASDLSRKKEVDLEVEEEEREEEISKEPVFNYYRSGVGGLKEIAQALDKAAKNASLDYAFTMNAGLSLHKPIKPFSLIHAYVRSKDLSYFEKVLQLTPSPKDTAQLCLITSDDDKIYAGRKELHGLYVVSDNQIKADLLSEGEVELANELD